MSADYNFRAQRLKNDPSKINQIIAVLENTSANYGSAYENAKQGANHETNRDSIFGTVNSFRFVANRNNFDKINQDSDTNDSSFAISSFH